MELDSTPSSIRLPTYPIYAARSVVLFGGTGFIGQHLARHLLRCGAGPIVLCARRPPKPLHAELHTALAQGSVRYVQVDLSEPWHDLALPAQPWLVANLAAKLPLHGRSQEIRTFNTNSTESICAWMERVNCANQIFISSNVAIGEHSKPADESVIPAPNTVYGESKLHGERLCRAWQEKSEYRRLLIVRPGMIYGATENSAFLKLLHALHKGFFFYPTSPKLPKGGGSVKELCDAMLWRFARQLEEPSRTELCHYASDPICTLQDYVETIQRVWGIRRRIPRLPGVPLLHTLRILNRMTSAFGLPFSPPSDALESLMMPYHTEAGRLKALGYPFPISLDAGIKDWKQEQDQLPGALG